MRQSQPGRLTIWHYGLILMSGDTRGVRFRPMERSDADLRLFKDCFDRNGSPRSLERLRWQFFEPPEGRLYVDFAEAGEASLAAIYAVFPVLMSVSGRRVLGVQSIDTLTD